MPSIHRNIWNKLGVKQGDSLPYNGAPWTMNTTRVTLLEIMAILGYKIGAEIGVEVGRFSQTMFSTIPNLKLFCVDPWQAYHRNSQSREDQWYERAKKMLEGHNVEIIKKTSMEGVKDIPDKSLDFVYIDALHDFDSVMTDIILWTTKVRTGGIVSGHDFVYYYQYGVVQAVMAYVAAHAITPWYITTEREPSWFFVKP